MVVGVSRAARWHRRAYIPSSLVAPALQAGLETMHRHGWLEAAQEEEEEGAVDQLPDND